MLAQVRFLAAFLFLAFVLPSCQTTQRLVEKGDYDGAVAFTVRNLQGKKKKDEFVRGLEFSFKKAQEQDFKAIDNLLAENRAENWEQINRLHIKIRERQQLVEPLLPLTSKDGYKAQIDLVDIEKLERESREKAAEYLYNEAKTLLARGERGEKGAAREAYYKLDDLGRKYFRNYRDSEQLKTQAHELGMSYILFEIKNQSNKVLPKIFAERLMAMSKRDLDSEWKTFYFDNKADLQYDYKVVFKINDIDVSPERVREREYIDEKTIEDGFDYVLDAKGNVMKDTLGNDIKTTHYSNIRANVFEVFQSKSARLTGLMEVQDMYNKTMLESRNLGTEVFFEHYSATFAGDQRALSETSRCNIGSSPTRFPSDEDLVLQAADRLKPNLRNELRSSRAIY